MKILVVGGTGTVGSEVVRALVARGVGVHVLTRGRPESEAPWEGVTRVHGDLLNPRTVRTVFRGMDGVFLLNAIATTEAHEGLMAINGLRMAGVRRVVYLSVHNVDLAPHLPHFGAKIAVEAAIMASGVPYTILRANNFFQNDLWMREAVVTHGLYPQPIGDIGLSRVDVRDIGDAAAIALTGEHYRSETVNLVGPDVHTGESTAMAWSEALGRPIRYAGNDLDAWEKEALQLLPAWMVFDFRAMYRYFQDRGLIASAPDIRRLTALLGHPPRRFADFARETAANWTAPP